MKTLLCLLAFVLGTALGQQGVNWKTVDLESNEIPANVKSAANSASMTESTVSIKVKYFNYWHVVHTNTTRSSQKSYTV